MLTSSAANLRHQEDEIVKTMHADPRSSWWKTLSEAFDEHEALHTAATTVQEAEALSAYYGFLYNHADSAMRRAKARAVGQEMKMKYDSDLHVFSTSAADYLAWLDPSRDYDPKFYL